MYSMEAGDADTRKFWKHYKYQERDSTCCCHALGAWLLRTAKTSVWIKYRILFVAFGRKVGSGVVPSQHRQISFHHRFIRSAKASLQLFLFYTTVGLRMTDNRVYVDHDGVENCCILTVENHFFQRHYKYHERF